MAKPSVMIIGGGLAGMAAAIKLAELECDVSIMSLLPVKRSHSVCAQGGINSVNDLTRQLGDSEWKHFDDTVYGGDFLQHQPPVKELAYWAPKIIDLMDRLGVTFNRTPEGFRDQRRFGGTLYQRTAFAGATTGQQLVYALDEQVRRWEVTGHIRKYEYWDFLGPVIDETGRCRGCVGQDLVSMEIRAFPADALVIASGGCGAIYGRSTNSVACNGAAVSRVYQAGGRYGNAEFIQVHPTAIPGADKLRLISESARGEGGRVWVPRKPQDPAPAAGHSREGTLLLPRRALSQVRQPRAPRHRHPRDLQGLHAGRPERAGRADVRLPRRDPHSPRAVGPQAGRHPGDLREVPRGRPPQGADEDLPRRPLHDGRAVGRLRGQRPRAA